MDKYKCDNCYDTGCSCGGIGLSCHGCCDCDEGLKARERRAAAMCELLAMTGNPPTEEVTNEIVDRIVHKREI